MAKWQWLSALLLTAALVLVGAAALARVSFTVDRRTALARGPIGRPHTLPWRWPAGDVLDVPESGSIGELVTHASACQTFVADYPGLSSVEVSLATYARRNSGPLIFRLKASPDAALLTLTLDASDVESNAYHTFEFPPIRDSANRSFCFCLEAPEAEPGKAITAWGHLEDVYPDGEAIFAEMSGQGVRDLAFRVGYRPSLPEKLDIVLDRIVENKSSVWGNKGLYVLLGVMYVTLTFLLLTRVMPD